MGSALGREEGQVMAVAILTYILLLFRTAARWEKTNNKGRVENLMLTIAALILSVYLASQTL